MRQYLPRMELWPIMVYQLESSAQLMWMNHRVDRSEHTLTQVAYLIVESNSDLAEFQPSVAVVATSVFRYVSCYYCS